MIRNRLSGVAFPAARVALRELRSGVRGFGVFLGCLWLGVFAMSAVGSLAASARQGILGDARAILGGDLELRLTHRPASPEVLSDLESLGRVSTVLELRAMVRPDVSSAATTPVLVEVKAVDRAYPLYGGVELRPSQTLQQALEFSNGYHGIAADALLLERLDLNVGDRISLGSATMQVRAVLVREPDRTVSPFTLGPRVLLSPEALTNTGLLLPGSLVRYRHRIALFGDRSPEKTLSELNTRFPDAGWQGRTFRQAAPRVRDLLQRMTTQLTLIALFTLLIGGLGVAGAVRGYLDRKLSHLAVLKCVGASRRQVFGAYLAQILTLGLLAAATAIAAGAAVPWVANAVGGTPFPLALAIFPRPLLEAAGFGLLVALLFSTSALDTAARVSPAVLFRHDAVPLSVGSAASRRRSFGLLGAGGVALLAALTIVTGDLRLSCWFVGATTVCFGVFHLLGVAVVGTARKVPTPRGRTWRLATANLARPHSAARPAILSLGMGLTALTAVAQVQGNLGALVARELPQQAPALFFFQIQEDQLMDFEAALGAVTSDAEVERFPTLRGRITHIAGQTVEDRDIDSSVRWAVRGDRFLTYSAVPPQRAQVVAGEWWPADYTGPPLVSLTADLAEGFGVKPGDTLGLNVLGRQLTVQIANLRQVDWSTLELNFAVILSPGSLEGAPLTYLAAVHLPETAERAALREVSRRLPNVSAVQIRDVLAAAARVIDRIGTVFRGMAGIALLAGALVLAGALSAEQHRRITEAVIYKVCGATRRDVLAVFGAEFLLAGVTAAVLSCVTGTVAAYAVVYGLMDLRFALYPTSLVLTALLATATTIGLGLLGTARALSRKPSQTLREG